MIEDVFKTVDRIISAQKTARRNNDYNTLITNAEAMLEYIPDLIMYSVQQESEYRKYEAKLSDESVDGKRNPSSYCDTKAKATDYYMNWQKTKQFIELLYEMVNMAKKLAGGVDKELNAH